MFRDSLRTPGQLPSHDRPHVTGQARGNGKTVNEQLKNRTCTEAPRPPAQGKKDKGSKKKDKRGNNGSPKDRK